MDFPKSILSCNIYMSVYQQRYQSEYILLGMFVLESDFTYITHLSCFKLLICSLKLPIHITLLGSLTRCVIGRKFCCSPICSSFLILFPFWAHGWSALFHLLIIGQVAVTSPEQQVMRESDVCNVRAEIVSSPCTISISVLLL